MASSVDVSVEALQECMVQEITLEGQEIYVSPLTMSENLTKMAHKIDFVKIENDDFSQATQEMTDDETDQETEQQPAAQPPLWPWESVRNKLRNCLMEVNVLQDILLIIKDNKYLKLHGADHDIQDTKNGLLLVARKRAMSTAATIINMGLERMRRNLEAVAKNKSQDFHYELLRLRKNFKLKKSGTKIFGDLSYKSSGSIYHMSGTFEVLKADNESVDGEAATPYSAAGVPTPSPTASNLSVIIPEELLGHAFIRVFVKEVKEEEFNFETFFSQNFSSSMFPAKQIDNLPWQKKLEMAQQVIYCKEAFEKMFLEAHGIKANIPNISCGNQLVCRLFPSTNLFVVFVHHRVGSSSKQQTKALGKIPDGALLFTGEPPDRVLEHCLYQLLRESHLRNAITPMPHPISVRLHSFKSEHLLGPGGYSLGQINNIVENLRNDTMLESLVKVAKLQVMRQRIADLLDEMARQICEPQLIVLTTSYFSTFKAAFRVSISFSGFDSVRTCFTIFVTHNSIEAASRDSYIQMSQGIDELREFILKQASENHTSAVLAVMRQFNWKVTSTHNEVVVSRADGTLDTGSGIVIVSPHNNRKISICCSKSGFRQVMLLTKAKEWDRRPGRGSAGWSDAVEGFRPVNMNRVPGLHFAMKLENLVALLTYDAPGKS